MANKTPIPLAQIAFLTPSGRVSDPWRQYLLALGDADGNAGGGDFGPILIALAELRQQDAATVSVAQSLRTDDEIPHLLMPVQRMLEQRDEGPVCTHGVQDDGSLHALATQTDAGFMSASDKTKLDGIAGGPVVEDIFTAGNGPGTFVPGTTTSLTLSKSYATSAGVLIHFDASFQGSDQYSVSGNTVTFMSAIPVGVSTVYARG